MMRVFVNNVPVDLLPGMTVRHALVAAGYNEEALFQLQLCDEWGNMVGEDGALSDGARIFTDNQRLLAEAPP